MMPWEVMPAEQMQPDPMPDPMPVVATNRATGQKIAVDFGPRLHAAIDQAITDAVAAHPVLGPVVRHHSERADRTIMQSSVIDVTVAAVAAVFTVMAPDSPTTGALWLAAAVLASRTMLQAAVHRLVPEAA